MTARLFGPGPGVLGCQTATGNQAMQMGMVHQVLAPGVENGGEAQLGLEPLLADLQERGAGAVEEQLIEAGSH